MPDCFTGDIRDAAKLIDWAANLDLVIHAAAIVPTGKVTQAPSEAITVNVGGTANVARAAALGGARLIYMSTAHVYRSSTQALAEDAEISPVSLYGLSKLQGEQWVSRLADDVLILRLFSYFDAFQAPTYLAPALRDRISAADQGAVLTLRGAASVRDMADADWIAATCLQLVEAGAGGVANVSANCPVTVLELAQRMSLAMGRGDIQWVPSAGDTPDYLMADRTKLEMLIKPEPFSLDRSISRFLDRGV